MRRRGAGGAARPGAEGAPIRFGTSGWRGILADEITLPRVRAAARAVATWLGAGPARPQVIVAHDTRFLGEHLARTAAGVLAAAGARALLARGAVPTPVAAHAVRRRRAAAGLVFTASHNQPEYQGMKVVASWGGAATPEQTRELERLAAIALAGPRPPQVPVPGAGVDLVTPYLEWVLDFVDRRPFRACRPAVAYDALHGAGAGVLDEALRRLGVPVQVLRAAPDPRFGGGAPDPVTTRLAELRRLVRTRSGPRLGLATDGDADRFAVIDADGRPLSEAEALALLVDHLARTGRIRRGVAVSVATGSLVECVAADHGLPVQRFPIGFKHLSRALRDGEADVAGEESGGFALDAAGRDKDGILAGCLLTELAATLRAPLRVRLRELERRHGRRRCGRAAVSSSERVTERLARLLARPPARLDGARVRSVERVDGLRLGLDDGFVMWRASGTEPVTRVYAEAPGTRALARRLAVGCRLLGSRRRVDDSPGSG